MQDSDKMPKSHPTNKHGSFMFRQQLALRKLVGIGYCINNFLFTECDIFRVQIFDPEVFSSNFLQVKHEACHNPFVMIIIMAHIYDMNMI